jgi:uncharacterized membrane protein (UPF0127 family)
VKAAAGAALAFLLAACQANGRDARPRVTDVTAEDFPAPTLPEAKVVVHDAFGGRHLVQVEVAADDPMRTRGLMWRRELPEGRGMLFIFPDEEVRGFWMRNTLIPLDMLFIAPDGTIVGIVPSAEPKTLKSRTVGKPSKYVLEVPGGWSEKKGVAPGNKVEFHGLAGIEVR